jgi:hypothetical protein
MHRLLVLGVTAAPQARELVEGLEVDGKRIGRRSIHGRRLPDHRRAFAVLFHSVEPQAVSGNVREHDGSSRGEACPHPAYSIFPGAVRPEEPVVEPLSAATTPWQIKLLPRPRTS